MEFIAKVDHGLKETHEKWNGKFLDKSSYDEVISSIGVDEKVIKIVNQLHLSQEIELLLHILLRVNTLEKIIKTSKILCSL